MSLEPLRIVFMGTPDFATPALRALLQSSAQGALGSTSARVVGVVTRPDKPAGRGRQVAYSPVKQVALAADVPVLQPVSLRRAGAQEELRGLAPDLIVVAAFGQILPPEVLQMPTHGCLNVHASLLPRWRGASPIAAAIRAGDAQTGVTIMLMDTGLDTGAIISQRVTPIRPEETTGDLTERLGALGAEALIEALPGWLSGAISPTPQDATRATMTRPLSKEDGRLDWTRPAEELARQVRACSPWPGAFTTWEGKLLKALRVEAIEREEDLPPGVTYALPPEDPRGPVACACGQGALALQVIQLEGKRALPTAEVLRGYPGLEMAKLGG